jgi:hypothetical protein
MSKCLPILFLSCWSLSALCAPSPAPAAQRAKASASAAVVDGACGMRAVQLLAADRSADLAALFGTQADALQAPLHQLRTQVGALTRFEGVAGPRFKQHLRRSVQAPHLPASYAYTGQWINADAALLGPVQFHVALSPAHTCQLLGLHVDVAR